MWIVSVVSLTIVCFLCPIGIFSKTFNDNILQRIGMGLLCLACCGRVSWIWVREYVDPSWMCVHLAIAIYAVGTAYKVTIQLGREKRWRWLGRADLWIESRRGGL